MIQVKNLLLDDLDKIQSKLGSIFVKDGENYRTTRGEGFVLIGSKNTLKIVDKIEFASLNRFLSQNRGK